MAVAPVGAERVAADLYCRELFQRRQVLQLVRTQPVAPQIELLERRRLQKASREDASPVRAEAGSAHVESRQLAVEADDDGERSGRGDALTLRANWPFFNSRSEDNTAAKASFSGRNRKDKGP